MAKKSFNLDGVKSVGDGYEVTTTVKSGKNTPNFKEWTIRAKVTSYAGVDAVVRAMRGLANMGRKVAVNAAGLSALRVGGTVGGGRITKTHYYHAGQGARRA